MEGSQQDPEAREHSCNAASPRKAGNDGALRGGTLTTKGMGKDNSVTVTGDTLSLGGDGTPRKRIACQGDSSA